MKVSIIPFILKKLKQGLGIVQDTDTATQAISQGKYVFWKGSVKKASSAISENDTLSVSNLGDVSGGALNDIADQIGTLNANLRYVDVDDQSLSVTIASGGLGLLVNKSIKNIVGTGNTIKAVTDVYTPGVAGYIIPAIGDNSTSLIIRGYNVDTTSQTVTRIKYRVWY